ELMDAGAQQAVHLWVCDQKCGQVVAQQPNPIPHSSRHICVFIPVTLLRSHLMCILDEPFENPSQINVGPDTDVVSSEVYCTGQFRQLLSGNGATVSLHRLMMEIRE